MHFLFFYFFFEKQEENFSFSGSGKTAAYLLPMLEKIYRFNELHGPAQTCNEPHGIIMVPSRELVIQVFVSKPVVFFLFVAITVRCMFNFAPPETCRSVCVCGGGHGITHLGRCKIKSCWWALWQNVLFHYFPHRKMEQHSYLAKCKIEWGLAGKIFHSFAPLTERHTESDAQWCSEVSGCAKLSRNCSSVRTAPIHSLSACFQTFRKSFFSTGSCSAVSRALRDGSTCSPRWTGRQGHSFLWTAKKFSWHLICNRLSESDCLATVWTFY